MLSLILLFKKECTLYILRQFSYSKEGYRDLTLVLLKSKSIHHYLVVATVRAGSRGGCATIVLQIQVSFEAYNPPCSSSQAKGPSIKDVGN